jgi:uncharacterized oxidoreductase
VYGKGVHVLNVFPGATSTPMMSSSKAGAEHGFEYESPDDVTAATLAGIADGEPDRRAWRRRPQLVIALDRQDPAAVDAALAGRRPELECAVADHSSL